MDEAQLIREAVAGDRDALMQLLESHGPEVRRSLAGKISPRWRSQLSEDDVMQETYADAFMNIRRFVPRDDTGFARWLRTLAQNNLIDAIRELSSQKSGGNRRQQPNLSLDDSYCDLMQTISASTTTPSRKAQTREMVDLMEQALQQMPAGYRQVIVLYDLHGLTAPQTAEQLQCSVGAMYMRRARAHALLAELLQKLA